MKLVEASPRYNVREPLFLNCTHITDRVATRMARRAINSWRLYQVLIFNNYSDMVVHMHDMGY